MKRVLVISPYFPPSNAADMHRVRMSLPYFGEFGWEAEVVTVSTEYSDMVKDQLLADSLPPNVQIHFVQALPKKLTEMLKVGSIAIRSFFSYRRKVNQLLKIKKYDLIYFSTTQFPVCILGAYWKKQFGIPFIIDMQDPWHTEYYQNKPKSERPAKYWFSYRFNKFLEPIAMRHCEGLISVSQAYIDDLKSRYSTLMQKPSSVITFGACKNDLKIVKNNSDKIPIAFKKSSRQFTLIYIGVSGAYMQKALKIIFSCFKRGLNENSEHFSCFRLIFIGTSYAPAGKGKKSVLPIAEEEGVGDFVLEQTDRIPFYSTLASLIAADGLVIPGTDDFGYTASKLYPYIMAQKPLLGVFHAESNAIEIINKCKAGQTITLNDDLESAYCKLSGFLNAVHDKIVPKTDWQQFEEYTARTMTEKQTMLFDEVLNNCRSSSTSNFISKLNVNSEQQL